MRYYTVDIALFGDALESQLPACWQAWRIVTGVQTPHMPDEPCIVRVKYSEDEDGFCVDSARLWMGDRRIYGNRREIAAECQRFLNGRPEWVWKASSLCPFQVKTEEERAVEGFTKENSIFVEVVKDENGDWVEAQ